MHFGVKGSGGEGGEGEGGICPLEEKSSGPQLDTLSRGWVKSSPTVALQVPPNVALHWGKVPPPSLQALIYKMEFIDSFLNELSDGINWRQR